MIPLKGKSLAPSFIPPWPEDMAPPSSYAEVYMFHSYVGVCNWCINNRPFQDCRQLLRGGRGGNAGLSGPFSLFRWLQFFAKTTSSYSSTRCSLRALHGPGHCHRESVIIELVLNLDIPHPYWPTQLDLIYHNLAHSDLLCNLTYFHLNFPNSLPSLVDPLLK